MGFLQRENERGGGGGRGDERGNELKENTEYTCRIHTGSCSLLYVTMEPILLHPLRLSRTYT
jgi:hypothetical protein